MGQHRQKVWRCRGLGASVGGDATQVVAGGFVGAGDSEGSGGSGMCWTG